MRASDWGNHPQFVCNPRFPQRIRIGRPACQDDGAGREHSPFGGYANETAVFAEVHPAISGTILKAADLGKIRFPEGLGLPPGVLIGILAAVAAGLFFMLPRTERREA